MTTKNEEIEESDAHAVDGRGRRKAHQAAEDEMVIKHLEQLFQNELCYFGIQDFCISKISYE